MCFKYFEKGKIYKLWLDGQVVNIESSARNDSGSNPRPSKNREEEINDLDLKAANQKSNNQLIDNSEID